MRSNWYWLKEFIGDAIMLLLVGWSAMLFGGIATYGYITFIENNPFILWTEIALVILLGLVAVDRLVDDVIGFGKEK